MVWHPLMISITALDLFILILLFWAGSVALDVILNWQPCSSSSEQLRLERRAEAADLMTQWAFVLLSVNTLITIVVLTHVLPRMIPGAMCGMGVMQALDGRGYQFIILRGLAFSLLYWQRRVAHLNRTSPVSPLTVLLARLALLAMMFEAMAAYDSLTTLFLHLDPSQPVSCCAAIYNRIDITAAESVRILWHSNLWPITFGITGLIILLFSIKSLWIPNRMKQSLEGKLLAVLGPLWMLAAGISLIYFFTPYIYQVLGHYCPFCLFLPEHYGIGFLLLGLLGWVGLESPLPYFLYHIQIRHPGLGPASRRRCRRSFAMLFVSVLGFSLLAGLPALVWRWRFGVWI